MVAQNIIAQLGGSTLALLGASQLVAREDGLQFAIGRNPKKVSKLVVVLAADDTYIVQAWAGRGLSIRLASETDGVYVDALHRTIESMTGLLTRF